MLQTTKQGDALTVYLTGEIDHCVAEGLRNEIEMLIVAHDPHRLILDFSQVSFMDSSGIGLVMGRYRLIREWNGSVEIHNPAPSIKKVMRLAGLDRIASIHSSPPKSGTNSTKTEAKI